MADVAEISWDACTGAELAGMLGVPYVEARATVSSTMDAAGALARQGAAAGSLVIAEEQTAGRGRAGRPWQSPAQSGIWLTLIERPPDASGIDVLSLRIGLHLAKVLERFSHGPVSLKWPNDLFVGRGKLAGVLVEARWHAERLDWVAIGVGVNTGARSVPGAASLGSAVVRRDVLAALVPALRAAVATPGSLSPEELDEFRRRDVATGRMARAPRAGRVAGLSTTGDLLIEADDGVHACRAGSLVLEDWP